MWERLSAATARLDLASRQEDEARWPTFAGLAQAQGRGDIRSLKGRRRAERAKLPIPVQA
jgi:hypothetical protein